MMNKNIIRANQVYGFLPVETDGVELLAELALDMRWSWNHAADKVWEQLDPALWELTHNPWVVLQTVSHDQLERQCANPGFRQLINELKKGKDLKLHSEAWFQQKFPESPLNCVAYFSMEYMLSEALPIYVGGLGNVAGDQLKSASDLGVPTVGIGLLYQQGYFRQEIDKTGSQKEYFPYNDPGSLPITPVRLPDGEWLRIKISLSGYPIWLRTWQVSVGNVKLYLLDSNDPANLPIHRGITSEIYGGGPELRIKQEMILGIGGWKMLKALGIDSKVCHLNEGHTAFAVLERANDFMKETGLSFEAALAITRAGNIFTTHTAVEAGFDHFSPSLMEQFFNDYARDELNIDFNALMALGRKDANNYAEYFNMAFLAFRGSGAVNGVSNLHGQVSRHLFKSIFPRWPVKEVPVGSVTNGVHVPSWDSEYADVLWTEACGKHRWKGDLKTIEADISALTDDRLWAFRNQSRNALVKYVRQRFERQITLSGHSSEIIERSKHLLDPDSLTLGFARRFVSYKRTNILLHDPERFFRLLTHPRYPVQLVLAGKAPPFDEEGKLLIRQWNQFIHQYDLHNHVVFLSDYDMDLAEHLVQGVDVWINTPRRPWEACGTSGMKVLVNGGLNLSELDGWWTEAYTPAVGWALGDALEHTDDPEWDSKEAIALYELLEQNVVPEFYLHNEKGIPVQWVEMMRKSMSTLTPEFSANRTVREYTEQYYLPAAAAFIKRVERNGTIADKIVSTGKLLKNNWAGIKFGDVRIETVQNGYSCQAQIFFDSIIQGNISVELFADGIDGQEPEKTTMELTSTINDEHMYCTIIVSERPASDYTIRIIPAYENVSIPIEDSHILWQR